MESFRESDRQLKARLQKKDESMRDKEWRAIAYSMDALVPGLYVWFGSIKIRIGGCEAEDTYPGRVNSFAGVALVLPGYRIYTTYQGSYDPL